MTEFSPQPPEQEQPLRLPLLLRTLGRVATYSCSRVWAAVSEPAPPLFQVLDEALADSPQPLHPSIDTTAENVHDILARHSIITPEPSSLSHKFVQGARMIQFTDRFAGKDQAFFEYDTIKELKDRFVASAKLQAHPLGFAQQLDIALELANDDSIQALTTLWFASRHYARWFDSVSIHNLPDLTVGETFTEMKEWRQSILACKNAGNKDFQDAAGDTYYAWTHALSRVIYGSGTSAADRIGAYVFSHGTVANNLVHKVPFLKQSLPSNHTIAANYGNRIGDAILDNIRTK